jgi:hypothetical protein
MEWSRASQALRRMCALDDDTAVLSRRETLLGIGLAGLFALAGPRVLGLGSAEAKPVNSPAVDAESSSRDSARAEVSEHDSAERNAADTPDVTEFSAQRWRRRYWRHRYWRRRWYWRRRYWRRRYHGGETIDRTGFDPQSFGLDRRVTARRARRRNHLDCAALGWRSAYPGIDTGRWTDHALGFGELIA